MPIFWEQLRGWTSIPDTFVRFFADQPGAFWLDRSVNRDQRFSVIGSGEVLPLRNYSLAELRELSRQFCERSDCSDLQSLSSDTVEPAPFNWRPGLVGAVDYTHEEVSGQGLTCDLIVANRALVFAHESRRMFFIGEFSTSEDFRDWFHAVLLRLALVGGDAAGYQLAKPAAHAEALIALTKQSDYESKIEQIKQWIASGEIYQACLTTQLTGSYSGDELSYFLKLRARHAAPHGAFIRANRTYASISPERLLSVSNGIAISSPIKGTRPRGKTATEDAQVKEELESNEKERAENLMIVDLVRNDLARNCEVESVTVSRLLEVQEHSTVFQLVSQVEGKVRSNRDALDVLADIFPAGSMTGAPKRRAIELLNSLEDGSRGAYSGAIGHLGSDGSLDLGMTIRTAVFSQGRVAIGVGGGITVDSVPQEEHSEIVLKAKAHLETLGAEARW